MHLLVGVVGGRGSARVTRLEVSRPASRPLLGWIRFTQHTFTYISVSISISISWYIDIDRNIHIHHMHLLVGVVGERGLGLGLTLIPNPNLTLTLTLWSNSRFDGDAGDRASDSTGGESFCVAATARMDPAVAARRRGGATWEELEPVRAGRTALRWIFARTEAGTYINSMYIYLYLCLYLYIYTHRYMHICVYINIYVYMYIHIHIHIYIYDYEYIHVHVYTYTCIYIHTDSASWAPLSGDDKENRSL